MIILRGNKKKKFSIKNLTERQKWQIDNCPSFQCGLENWFAKYIADVPEIFKDVFDYVCKKHDLGWRRGGGILDFLESQWNYIWRSHYTIVHYLVRSNLPIINRILKVIILLFLLEISIPLLFITGIRGFNWGEYKPFNDILEEANCL